MVDDLRGQKVKLDVGVCDMWTTADESSALQVSCCSIAWGRIAMVSKMVEDTSCIRRFVLADLELFYYPFCVDCVPMYLVSDYNRLMSVEVCPYMFL